MIYLIDDNQNNQRQKQYNIDFVENRTFKEILTSIERIERHEYADDISHLEFLKDAKCILLHVTTADWDEEKGFLEGSITNVTKIKETIACEGEKIPLVLFSNKMNEKADYDYKKNPDFICEIKKNILYERLYDFLEYYKNADKIELRILAFGKNFQAHTVSCLAKELLGTVASISGKEKFLITNISASSKLPIFREFIEISLPNADFKSIIFDLEDNPINVNEFQNKINLITESFLKYGKNIYNW